MGKQPKRLIIAAALTLATTAPVRAEQQPADEPPPAKQPDVEAAAGEAPSSPPATPGDTATAADVASAPRPDDAGGTVAPIHDGPSPLRRTGQVLLFVPKWAVWVAFAPVRGGLWAFNRFQLGDQFQRIFFNDEGTLGIFPVAFFETGLGLNAGVRFVYRDLFGTDGKLQARASYGGQFRQLYSGKATTGHLFGDRFEGELEGESQIFPKSRFFGIGNEDDISAPPAMPIDPLTDETAVKTRYHHDDFRIELTAAIGLWSDLSLRLSGAYKHRSFDEDADLRSGEVDIFEAYDRMNLIGFDTGLSNLYPEAELVWDSRHPTSRYISGANPGAGSKVGVFAGYARGFGDDPSAHWRYGIDVQRHLDLYAGDRYLVLRAYLEGVTGSLDEVPFVDLPRLGGRTFLRGYDKDRFRDRIAVLGTIEYNYPLAGNVSGYLFSDTGRVYRSFDAMDGDSLEDFHLGFGGGLQMHTANTFIARVSLASSIDGGLFFALSFDPVFDTRSREESP